MGFLLRQKQLHGHPCKRWSELCFERRWYGSQHVMETPCLNEAHGHDVHVLSRISKTSPPVVSRCRSFSIGTSQNSIESGYSVNSTHLFRQQGAKHVCCDCNFEQDFQK